MDRNQYASFTPLDPDHLLEKVAEYQREIDAKQSTVDDMKEDLKKAQKAIASWQGKIALVGRAHESGHDVYQLAGGELTTEAPDALESGALPFGDEHGETAEADDEQDAPEPPKHEDEPAEEILPEATGNIYEAYDPKGDLVTAYKAKDGWWARWHGKPLATRLPTLRDAKKACEQYLNTDLSWSRLDLAEEETAQPLTEPEVAAPGDLTEGL